MPQTDARFFKEVGAKLIREADSFSEAGGNPSLPEIKSLEQDVVTTLAILRRGINAYESGIYRLYPEILSRVASNLLNHDLIKATHVSHLWRTTLISSPRLWTNISFLSENETFAFVERSKSTPISVFMDVPLRPGHATAISFLDRHATRIEALNIAGVKSPIHMLLPPMPALKKLVISWDRIHSLHTQANGQIQALNLPSVKTLIVRGVDSAALHRGKLPRLLKRCPLLEELEVDYDGGVVPIQDRNIVIRLPRLRYYAHSTRKNARLDLVDMLSLPSSCSLVFNYWNGSRKAHETDRCLPFHNPSPLASLMRIKLEVNNRDAMVELIDARNARVHLVVNASPGGQDLDLGDYSDIHKSYSTYLETLETHAVRVLCIGGPLTGLFCYFEQILSLVPGIRTLVLYDSLVTSYLFAHGSGGGGGANNWLCPMLDVLVVHSHNILDDCGKNNLCHLPRIVQRRKKDGLRLRSVSFFCRSPWDEEKYGPIESHQTLVELRECVGEFKIVMGDDALDWSVDDHFFGGLDVRRDRKNFRGREDELGFSI